MNVLFSSIRARLSTRLVARFRAGVYSDRDL